MARAGKTNSAEAADHLDRVVNEILSSLKRGKSADMPGLGSFRRTAGGRIRFDQEGTRLG